MSNITGRAKRYDGSAIDYAMLYDWDKGYSIAKITPNESGVWSYRYYRDMKIGIAYVADGCEPITHGPYIFVAEWSPLFLFEGGVRGVFYDPSDLSTMFQNHQGTVPVTANGQPVGLIMDKSGNNFHARQTALNSRPIYRTDGEKHWLSFDGVDDSFVVEYPILSKKHSIALSFNLLNRDGQKGIFESFGDTSASPDYKKGSRVIYYDGIFYHQFGDGVDRVNSPMNTPENTKATAILVTMDDKKISSWLNNNASSIIHTKTMLPAIKTYIGSNSEGKWFAKMDFYGALVLERNVTDSESSQIREYLAAITAY